MCDRRSALAKGQGYGTYYDKSKVNAKNPFTENIEFSLKKKTVRKGVNSKVDFDIISKNKTPKRFAYRINKQDK